MRGLVLALSLRSVGVVQAEKRPYFYFTSFVTLQEELLKGNGKVYTQNKRSVVATVREAKKLLCK